MLPNELFQYGIERTKTLCLGALPEVGCLKIETMARPELSLWLEKILSVQEPDWMKHQLLRACRLAQTTSDQRAALVTEKILQFILSPTAAVQSPVPQLAALQDAALDVLLDGGSGDLPYWEVHREAVMDQIRLMDSLAFAPAQTERLANHRTSGVKMNGTSLVERMRAGQRLSEFYQILMWPDTPPETVCAIVKQLHGLTLNRQILPVILAHAFRLICRQPSDPLELPCLLVSNLKEWLRQLEQLKKDWVTEVRGTNRFPELQNLGIEQYQKQVYVVQLHQELTRIVDVLNQEPDVIPDITNDVAFFENALNDLTEPLIRQGLTIWSDCPMVLVSILECLTGLRTVRYHIRAIFDWLVGDNPMSDESVQLAVLRLVGSFLTGFSAEVAHLQSRLLVIQSGDERQDKLTSEVRTLLESDSLLRQQIESIALNPVHFPQVRTAAMELLLNARPAEAELNRLTHLASQGDFPLIEALLRYVIRTRAQTAFRELEFLLERKETFPPPLRQLFLVALQATAHAEVPEILHPDFIAGGEAADQAADALRQMGAHGILNQFQAEQTIKANVGQVTKLDRQRAQQMEASTKSLVRALESNLEANLASIEASSLGMQGHITANQFMVECTDVQVSCYPVRVQLKEMLRRIPDLEGEISTLLTQAERLRSEQHQIEAAINECYRGIKQAERDCERCQQKIIDLQAELRSTESKASHCDRQVSAARQAHTAAERTLSSLQSRQYSIPDGEEYAGERNRLERDLRSARRECDQANREVGRLSDELEKLRTRIQTIPQHIDGERRSLERLRGKINNLTAQVDTLRARLPELNRREHSARRQASLTQAELDELQRKIRQMLAELNRLLAEGKRQAHQRRQELQNLQAEQARQLQLLRDRERTGSHQLGQAQEHRNQAVRLQTHISHLEQINSNLQSEIESAREPAAIEIGRVHQRAAQSEIESVERQRILQEVGLNVDLLLTMLKHWLGPTREAKRILHRLEAL